MTKPFRNNGVEGGYASFGTSCWLAGQQREASRRATKERDVSIRWNISAAKEKPVKDSASWRFEPDPKCKAVLLAYAADGKPAMHGSWLNSLHLWGRGLIELVKEPNKWLHFGEHEQPKGLGALFVISGRGRQYIDWLKAKGD